MTLPRELGAKVANPIRLLDSPIDGEVLAAARAIGRLLRAAGYDFHALADALIAPTKAAATPRRRQPRAPRSASGWAKLVDELLTKSDELTARDADFLRSVRRYRTLSPAQQAWVKDIRRKVYGSAEAA